MDIVILAAGTSSRMGKTNKMLIPYGENTLVAHCCLNALEYLAKTGEPSKLIVVTGYRHLSLNKALAPCKKFIEQTDSEIKLIIVNNRNYRNGQFSSTKVGVNEVDYDKPFFITLADMPDIKERNYSILKDELQGYDAVRAVVNGVPGHPVLLSSKMKKEILDKPDSYKVSTILKDHKTKELPFSDSSWIHDLDFIQDIL